MIHLALFASGSGSNVQNIIHHFASSNKVKVALVVTNNPKAGVIERAQKAGVPLHILEKIEVNNGDFLVDLMTRHKIDFIILGGYLKMIPVALIETFPEKIINIHPSLLPKHGGKGMFGLNVHKAVIENRDKKTGITIHFVNEEYDKGRVILQKEVEVGSSDTLYDVENKVRMLEQEWFPQTIESVILSK